MRLRSLLLPVLLYVGLDFAAPLIPGAISFEEGVFRAVQGDRSRADSTFAPCLAASERFRPASPVVPSPLPSLKPAPPADRCRHWMTPAPRGTVLRKSSATPDDDQ